MNRLSIVYSKQFQKDYKLALKRHLDVDKLDNIINMISRREPLPPSLRDHPLKSQFKGYRELHIAPNWLLVYKIFENQLELYCFRVGGHQEVFKKRPDK